MPSAEMRRGRLQPCAGPVRRQHISLKPPSLHQRPAVNPKGRETERERGGERNATFISGSRVPLWTVFSHEFRTALRLRSYFNDGLEQGALYPGRPAGFESTSPAESRCHGDACFLFFLCVCVCARVRVRCVSLVCPPVTSKAARLAPCDPSSGSEKSKTNKHSHRHGRHLIARTGWCRRHGAMTPY